MFANEEKFLKQINSKHINAYDILFQKYYNILVMFSMKYVVSQEIAEDIVQDLFVTLWENDTKYSSYNGFKSFLYNSVRNASLNYIKHKNVEKKYADAKLFEENYEERIDFRIMEEELYRILFNVIEELPPKCKEIFELHLKKMSNEEIASSLQLSILTVKTQKKRAVRYIKERMGNFYYILLPILGI